MEKFKAWQDLNGKEDSEVLYSINNMNESLDHYSLMDMNGVSTDPDKIYSITNMNGKE